MHLEMKPYSLKITNENNKVMTTHFNCFLQLSKIAFVSQINGNFLLILLLLVYKRCMNLLSSNYRDLNSNTFVSIIAELTSGWQNTNK